MLFGSLICCRFFFFARPVKLLPDQLVGSRSAQEGSRATMTMSDNSSPPPWGRMRMTLTQAEDGRSKEAERRGQGVNGVYTRWQSPGPDSSLPTASLSLSIATSAMLERRLRGGNSLGPPSGSPISLSVRLRLFLLFLLVLVCLCCSG